MTLHINTKDKKEVAVSLFEDGEIIETQKAENEFGSQVLLNLINSLKKLDNLKSLKEITVEEGPGSYTGLRVGASVAQVLGFALGIPVNGKLNTSVELRYTE